MWRPLRGPVDNSPLGLIDAASMDKEDLLELSLHFPGRWALFFFQMKYLPLAYIVNLVIKHLHGAGAVLQGKRVSMLLTLQQKTFSERML